MIDACNQRSLRSVRSHFATFWVRKCFVPIWIVSIKRNQSSRIGSLVRIPLHLSKDGLGGGSCQAMTPVESLLPKTAIFLSVDAVDPDLCTPSGSVPTYIAMLCNYFPSQRSRPHCTRSIFKRFYHDQTTQMAPQLGLGHTSPSSYHPSKGESIPATRTAAEAEALKAMLPKVISLDAQTATVDQIVEAMKVAGGLVIRNAVSHEALDKIESRQQPFL